MYQPPNQPQQPSNTSYPSEQWQQQYPPQPPYQQSWQQPPVPQPAPTWMHPQRYVRQQYKTAAIVCFLVALTIASVGVPVFTLLAGLLLLAGIVLVFLI